MKRWIESWWERTRFDWLVFAGMVEVTGIAVASPAILVYQAVTLIFRLPAYTFNAIDYRLGHARELRLTADVRKAVAAVRAFASTLREMAILLARG